MTTNHTGTEPFRWVIVAATALWTVREHTCNAHKKLGVQSRAQLGCFAVIDLLELGSRFDACFEMAFDWLVLHHVFPADRPRYAANVHRMLRPGRLYLSVCFSEDDRGIAGKGKYRRPRLGTRLYLSSEREIRELVEPLLDVLGRDTVDVEGSRSPHRAVRVLMRKRARCPRATSGSPRPR